MTMTIEEEIWKDIPTYENQYQASSLGRIRGLSRISFGRKIPTQIIKPHPNRKYHNIYLRINGKAVNKKLHILVAMAFLNHVPSGYSGLVVDHIDNDQSNNKVSNLQIISRRENSSKDQKNKTSKYTGVCWYKSTRKWVSSIWVNKVKYKIGYFDNELEAHQAYLVAVENAKNGIAPSAEPKKDKHKKYIYPTRGGEKFIVVLWRDKKNKTIGLYDSLDLAIIGRDNYLKNEKEEHDRDLRAVRK